MSQSRAGIHNRCPSCKLNNGLCLCEHIRPFSIESHISLIVHVRELKLTSNTAQFVEKLLPHNSKIFIRGRLNDNFDADPVMEEKCNPLFLYPHDDALELNEEFKQAHPGPYHIIVPDGNWRQARRVRKREGPFNNVLAVKLPQGILTEYKLRKASRPEWLSTFEAVAYALGILEGKKVQDHMMDFFRLWVKTSVYNRTKIHVD